MGEPFDYAKWLATLRPNDQKAFTEYLEGDEPELEDMSLLEKAEMSGSGKFKPLSLNRIWKAVQGLVKTDQGEKLNGEEAKALQNRISELELKIKQKDAEKERLFMQLSHLQRIYAQLLQENESLKNRLRMAGSKAEGKGDVWIPNKSPPPNMLQDPSLPKPKSSKFYRPDRASTHF
eukprot:CAMPEP_0114520620 /NCGR_PEP_ID=MMETSP0109-20121206/19705_1 /TAXON_ID=29199 /ORGANISM="Chlorarachnion reptans, Strain CCCM449" /LENGTH=176 /DNA_ID=CAMNT_0001701581 /DNA_START=171 /DNA_END=701 /DNA_ORIENTATION=+